MRKDSGNDRGHKVLEKFGFFWCSVWRFVSALRLDVLGSLYVIDAGPF